MTRSLGLLFLLMSCLQGNTPLYSQAQSESKVSRANTPAPDKVVISTKSFKITAQDAEKMLENFPPQQRAFYSGSGKRVLADYIVNSLLLAKEAEKRHLDESEDVKLRLKLAHDAILMFALQQAVQKEMAPTTEVLQKFLDDNARKYEEARVRRIVIQAPFSLPNSGRAGMEPPATNEEAKAKADEIRKKLLEGGDFEELAAKFSSDTLSFGKGGDLGYIRRGNKVHLVVPPLEEVIFSIPVGTISEVQATALGYEIVRVEDRRKPKLEDIRKELETDWRNQKYEEFIKELRSSQNVEIDEEFFKPVTRK